MGEGPRRGEPRVFEVIVQSINESDAILLFSILSMQTSIT